MCANAGLKWWARLDSNQEPDRYERSALTIELRAQPQASSTTYIRNSRLALPLAIFALSSSDNGARDSHCVAGLLSATNGQSTANRMRSAPSSCIEQSSAVSEKLPLVVIQKCLQNTSRNVVLAFSGRDKA